MIIINVAGIPGAGKTYLDIALRKHFDLTQGKTYAIDVRTWVVFVGHVDRDGKPLMYGGADKVTGQKLKDLLIHLKQQEQWSKLIVIICGLCISVKDYVFFNKEYGEVFVFYLKRDAEEIAEFRRLRGGKKPEKPSYVSPACIKKEIINYEKKLWKCATLGINLTFLNSDDKEGYLKEFITSKIRMLNVRKPI